MNRIDQGSLALGDNAPLFDEGYAQWYYETSPIRWLVLNLDGRLGEIADADNLLLGDMTEVKPKFTLLMSKLRLSLGHTYRDFDTDGETLWRENFTTVQGVYRPKKGHAFRLLLLRDTTDRDTSRYVGDELAFEKETEFEFTYLYQRPSGLNILAGIKVEREEDSETAEYTSGRLGYIKFVYDFGRGYNVDKVFDQF